ncbi:MAG: methylenetetrahydrofolate reductase C-terminal domain-containing protein [Peptococcaceae bacterium]
MVTNLQKSLQNKFSVTWELVPGRGAREKNQEIILDYAAQAAKGRKIDAISLTDNPGGSPGILPDELGSEIIKLGIEPLIHFTCKDKNRNQMESQLYALDRVGIRNILVMTGDYSLAGFKGRPKPVFDLDSVQALELISQLNRGLEIPSLKGTVILKPGSFFAGAAVSPFKGTEAEQLLQYGKLSKKIKNGANFIITQVGYDARKYQELLLFKKLIGVDTPVIGNIFLLTPGSARLMNGNKIPGCVVTKKLLQEVEQEKSDPQAKFLRAAKLYAVLKGIGYSGVHIGGHNLSYEQVEYVIDKGEELSSSWETWVEEFEFPQDNAFYFFKKDPLTGLNKNEPAVNNKKNTKSAGIYQLSRLFHKVFFIPGKNLFGFMQKASRYLDKSKLKCPFHKIEYLLKAAFYGCKDCGDCALPDIAYVCPVANCPKNQRNGPCEGSYYGWCEVYPYQKKCIWVTAFKRLREYNEEKSLNAYYLDPYNWELNQTSSWLNFYLGRDHSAARLDIAKEE